MGCAASHVPATPRVACAPPETPSPLRDATLDGVSSGASLSTQADSPPPRRVRSASPAPGLSDYATLSLRHVHKKLKRNHRVFRVCLTGGPCAGKSTLLTQLQTKIPPRTGYKVYCVPEAATLLVTGGMQWDAELVEDQQLALLRVQMALEDQFYSVALAAGKPAIVISDRGTMDGRAFCSEAIFQRILTRLNTTLETLRDRYDAVVHLVTAAAGAADFYNLDNPARYEGIAEAVESDKKLRQVYVGHPLLRIVDNSTTFEEKMERGLAIVGQVIGQKFSMQNTTYYLVRHCPKQPPGKFATCTLTITFLCNSHLDDVRLLIRREHSSGECMYFFNSILSRRRHRHGANPTNPTETESTAKDDAQMEGSMTTSAAEAPLPCETELQQAVQSALAPQSDSGQRVRNEQRISSKEYSSLIRHRDPQRRDVVLHAMQFLHEESRYEVTTIVAPAWAAGKQAMTLECDDLERAVFPSFIEVDREVPMDSLSTAFLIAHCETGPLYTALAYAPVFSRTIATRAASSSRHREEVGKETEEKENATNQDTNNNNNEKSKKVDAKSVTAKASANGSVSDAESRPRLKLSPTPINVEEEVEKSKKRLNKPKLKPIPTMESPPPLPSGPPTRNPRRIMHAQEEVC